MLGVEGQSVALARALGAQGWDVVLADPDAEHVERLAAEDLDERHIPAVDAATLDTLLTDRTAAVVALLPDDADNLRALRYASERYGIDRLVARPAGPDHQLDYEALGAFVDRPRLGDGDAPRAGRPRARVGGPPAPPRRRTATSPSSA